MYIYIIFIWYINKASYRIIWYIEFLQHTYVSMWAACCDILRPSTSALWAQKVTEIDLHVTAAGNDATHAAGLGRDPKGWGRGARLAVG